MDTTTITIRIVDLPPGSQLAALARQTPHRIIDLTPRQLRRLLNPPVTRKPLRAQPSRAS